jgi:hypothetical protein
MKTFLDACHWIANNEREFVVGMPRCAAQLSSVKLVAALYDTVPSHVVRVVEDVKAGHERVARAFRGEG